MSNEVAISVCFQSMISPHHTYSAHGINLGYQESLKQGRLPHRTAPPKLHSRPQKIKTPDDAGTSSANTSAQHQQSNYTVQANPSPAGYHPRLNGTIYSMQSKQARQAPFSQAGLDCSEGPFFKVIGKSCHASQTRYQVMSSISGVTRKFENSQNTASNTGTNKLDQPVITHSQLLQHCQHILNIKADGKAC